MTSDLATRRLLYEIPGMESVPRQTHEFPGSDGNPLPMTIYGADPAALRPAVAIVEGYPDPGFARLLGCRFMDMAWSVSTAQLIAASGCVAITYANREPLADLDALMEHVAAHGAGAGIDTSRIKLLGRMDVIEKRRPQDGRIKTRTPDGQEVELRLSTLPTAFGEKLEYLTLPW